MWYTGDVNGCSVRGEIGRLATSREDVVELIVRELRQRREELERLLCESGQLVIHVNRRDCQEPVRIEARVHLT